MLIWFRRQYSLSIDIRAKQVPRVSDQISQVTTLMVRAKKNAGKSV